MGLTLKRTPKLERGDFKRAREGSASLSVRFVLDQDVNVDPSTLASGSSWTLDMVPVLLDLVIANPGLHWRTGVDYLTLLGSFMPSLTGSGCSHPSIESDSSEIVDASDEQAAIADNGQRASFDGDDPRGIEFIGDPNLTMAERVREENVVDGERRSVERAVDLGTFPLRGERLAA